MSHLFWIIDHKFKESKDFPRDQISSTIKKYWTKYVSFLRENTIESYCVIDPEVNILELTPYLEKIENDIRMGVNFKQIDGYLAHGSEGVCFLVHNIK